jgi:tRNA/tmRNA/rRNA uracil-C5-methylase (TrmA/RlmC/RlmD family)
VVDRPATHYRVRSRLAVRGRVREPQIGIFEQGSHWVTNIPECLVHHASVNRAADALRRAIQISGTAPYTERTHGGLVRYAQLVVERATGRVQIVIVGNTETAEPLTKLFDELKQQLGSTLHSLWFSPNTLRGNAILGPRCEHIAGPQTVSETFQGAQVFFPPDAFGQSHLALYGDVIARIATFVPDGADVLELYAGVGAIGLSLAPRAARVRFNELSEGSLCGLALGIAALPEEVRARTSVHPGSVADHTALIQEASVVIADPPRKGLASALTASLVAHPPERFIYLSCDIGTFLRDAALLLATPSDAPDGTTPAPTSGAMRLISLAACDFFPFTAHLETLAVFERSPSPQA